MSLSAYLIGDKVWIVNTDKTADPETPKTLPIGSVVLESGEALDFASQIIEAVTKVRFPANQKARKAGRVKA